jgi:(E)-4-hydroxy-3-methylbut-2-enyl-diphosphate synthase
MDYKTVKVGAVPVGGAFPVSIQSMCSIPFSRFRELVFQAKELEEAGCEILRVSVPDSESAELFASLKKELNIPLVADIHFDYRMALAAIDAGADKIRINPGNIGTENIKQVVKKAKEHGIPIRIGVNSGSLEKDILKKYSSPLPEALAESAKKNVEILEKLDFGDIIVSIKSSDVRKTVQAYRIFDRNNTERYPLHIGVTEAGTLKSGLIKNSAGIGALLLDGIGSTIRYSLSAPPVEEVTAAKALLRSLGLRNDGAEIVACPTCGRTTIDVSGLASELEKKLAGIKKHLKIAVMGCVVNGPGEAAEADIGVTGAAGKYVVFKKECGGTSVVLKDADRQSAMEYILNFAEKYEG